MTPANENMHMIRETKKENTQFLFNIDLYRYEIRYFANRCSKINTHFMKTAVISTGTSFANAGKQERHAHKHSAILPGVGKTKEAGFTD